jgi:hypothetical protein
MLLDNGTERRSETRDVLRHVAEDSQNVVHRICNQKETTTKHQCLDQYLHSACMRVERQYRESISDNLRRWNLIPLCRLQQIAAT